MTTLAIYLTFEGNCERAFQFYKTVFRKELDNLMRYKEAPSGEITLKEDEANLVINVSLSVSEHQTLMGCDRPPSSGSSAKGDNYAITVGPDTKEEAIRLFNELAVGGKIGMPLHDTFWGAHFGMLTDQFGIKWMINYMYQQS